MGIGTGLFLIVLGAIFAFAIKFDVWWIDLQVVGIVIILAGAAVLFLTLYFWRERRRRNAVSVVEETQLVHREGPVPPDPPDVEVRQPPGLP
jgi:membrane protein implicated in regulation of membrane protease activity